MYCIENSCLGHHLDIGLKRIVSQKTYVADGVVLTFAGGAEYGYRVPAFGHAVTEGFGEVVGILFRDMYRDVGELLQCVAA